MFVPTLYLFIESPGLYSIGFSDIHHVTVMLKSASSSDDISVPVAKLQNLMCILIQI